jgi:hypothetical protein
MLGEERSSSCSRFQIVIQNERTAKNGTDRDRKGEDDACSQGEGGGWNGEKRKKRMRCESKDGRGTAASLPVTSLPLSHSPVSRETHKVMRKMSEVSDVRIGNGFLFNEHYVFMQIKCCMQMVSYPDHSNNDPDDDDETGWKK